MLYFIERHTNARSNSGELLLGGIPHRWGIRGPACQSVVNYIYPATYSPNGHDSNGIFYVFPREASRYPVVIAEFPFLLPTGSARRGKTKKRTKRRQRGCVL